MIAIDSTSVALRDSFAALADPVRLRIVRVLADGGRCVCNLRNEVPIAPNLLSYHLRVLRDAGDRVTGDGAACFEVRT
jgi:ArsR family transcriptional regulator